MPQLKQKTTREIAMDERRGGLHVSMKATPELDITPQMCVSPHSIDSMSCEIGLKSKIVHSYVGCHPDQ